MCNSFAQCAPCIILHSGKWYRYHSKHFYMREICVLAFDTKQLSPSMSAFLGEWIQIYIMGHNIWTWIRWALFGWGLLSQVASHNPCDAKNRTRMKFNNPSIHIMDSILINVLLIKWLTCISHGIAFQWRCIEFHFTCHNTCMNQYFTTDEYPALWYSTIGCGI